MSDFEIAKAQFEDWSVDVEEAIKEVSKISISVHCWQGMMWLVLRALKAYQAAEFRQQELSRKSQNSR